MIKGRDDTITVQGLYDMAMNKHKVGQEITDNNIKQVLAGLSAKLFWKAATFGHPKAPFMLSCCFAENIGVKANKSIENFWLGVASGLKDARCKDSPKVPKSMTKDVKYITNLIENTHEKNPLGSLINLCQSNKNELLFNLKIHKSIRISMLNWLDCKPNDRTPDEDSHAFDEISMLNWLDFKANDIAPDEAGPSSNTQYLASSTIDDLTVQSSGENYIHHSKSSCCVLQ